MLILEYDLFLNSISDKYYGSKLTQVLIVRKVSGDIHPYKCKQ